MRYIPDFQGDLIVQVPEDRNSYVNVLSFGASGKGDIRFSGTVTNVQDDTITIDGISDGQGNTISQYRTTLKDKTALTVFTYNVADFPDSPIISVSNQTSVGVDFSSSSATNPNLATLTYYVFGFDPVTGVLPNFRSTTIIGTKVLNPDLWNTSQYVQLSFSRTSQNALPIIYRVWGNRVDFLGVIGANKVGYPGSGNVVFRDLGLTEIPSWSDVPTLPWYLSNVFSVGGSNVTQVLKLTGKFPVTIQPNLSGSQTSFIRGKAENLITTSSPGDTARFIIDDTKFIQDAVKFCASSPVKEVFFPAGTYNVSDTYFLTDFQTDYSNISMRGVGSASIIKRLPCTLSVPQYPGLINFTGQSVSPRVRGIRIRTLAVDGNSSESFSSVTPITNEEGIRIQYGDNVIVDECVVTGCGGGGIGIYDTKGASVTYNTIRITGRPYEQPVSPITLDTCENIIAQGNLMEFSTTGPKLVSTDFSTVNGNIVRGCGDKGIDVQTSFQWSVQGNLAYSDNDSIIRSIDTYNNEYSRATIEVRKGIALDPLYMTVTLGGESVSIVKNSISAEIYPLGVDGVKTTPLTGYFRVLETSAQLEAGIFSLTLPGTETVAVGGRTIPSTNSLTNANGYMYEVKATVVIGNSGRGYQPLSIRSLTIGSTQYVAIELRNPSDLLSLQIYSASSTENDDIRISGFTNPGLSAWDQNSSYTVVGIDTDTNSLLLDPIPGLSLSSTPVQFLGAPKLTILRSDYFVADGNLFVHSF